MRQTIAIVGAGFSGAALVIQLLRRAERPIELVLINRSGPMARGLAFGTRSSLHVLNVPAARMSLFPDRETDFLSFAQRHAPSIKPGDFVPRSLYGLYLETRLAEALAGAHRDVRYRHISAEVVDLDLTGPGVRLLFEDGSSLDADRAVLATGNFAPGVPAPLAGIAAHPGFIRDPWERDVLQGIAPDRPVLLIGTSLTMYDMALSLAGQGHQATMYAISRRGLLPQPHRDNVHPPTAPELPATLRDCRKTLDLVRSVRRLVAEHARQDHDWRDVIGALRPVTPALWQRLPLAERRRFLRHVLPYWEVHRHRAAPAVAERITALRASNQLRVIAGRLLDASGSADGLRLDYQERGQNTRTALHVARVINCTGPQSDIRLLESPLFANLLRKHLVQPDPLGLGLKTEGRFGIIDAEGKTSGRLSLIGPMLKADYWESTAVPELRKHAEQLSEQLLNG
jgi:uncharacterized NAD(P)/FAD-binding protein YdhS